MADSAGTIITLWRDLVARLESSSEFTTEPKLKVFMVNEGSPEKMQEALTGAVAGVGLAVLIDEPQVQTIDHLRLRMVAQIGVAEDAVLATGVGGTKRRARDIAEHIVTLIRGWTPNSSEPLHEFRLTNWAIPREQGGSAHILTFTAPLMAP